MSAKVSGIAAMRYAHALVADFYRHELEQTRCARVRVFLLERLHVLNRAELEARLTEIGVRHDVLVVIHPENDADGIPFYRAEALRPVEGRSPEAGGSSSGAPARGRDMPATGNPDGASKGSTRYRRCRGPIGPTTSCTRYSVALGEWSPSKAEALDSLEDILDNLLERSRY